nr:MptD family putative ECF transporter S component [Treponema putidum]
METKTNKLNARDFIFIGIFAAVALLIFFITGALAALTLFGTIANIPITLFFVSIAFMLAVSKVRKTGVFFYYGDNYRFTGIYGSKRNRRRPFNYRLVHCGDSCVNDEVQR